MGAAMLCVNKAVAAAAVAAVECGVAVADGRDDDDVVCGNVAAVAAADVGVGVAAAAAADEEDEDAVVVGVGADVVVAAVAANEDGVADAADDVATTTEYVGVAMLPEERVEGSAVTTGGHSSSAWKRVHLMHPTLKWRSVHPP